MTTNSASSTLLSPELLARLEKMELVSRKIFRGRMKDERQSRRKGQSVEFADFRNYVPGDDLRFIDWNTYARLDRLFLKMFLEEVLVGCVLARTNTRRKSLVRASTHPTGYGLSPAPHFSKYSPKSSSSVGIFSATGVESHV
jgi:hypothetical protein